MNYILQVLQGKNEGWTYLFSLLIILLFWMLLGSLPLIIVIAAQGIPASPPENPMDFEAYGIDFVTGMILIILGFATGLVGIYISVKYIHQRTLRSLITASASVRWRRVLLGALIWLSLLMTSFTVHYLVDPANYSFQFSPGAFYPLLVTALLFIPLQSSFEELFIRGYLLQGTGLIAGNRWAPVLFTSLIFGLLHSFNPEVEEFGFWLAMPQYFGWGLFLGLIAVLDEGIEIPLGIHAINNIFAAVVLTHSSFAIQTPALFTAHELNPVSDMIEFYLMIILVLIVLSVREKYDWKKLFRQFL